MRRTKFAGLNPFARNLAATAVKVEKICNLSSVFEDLRRYTMPDGTVYNEYVQTVKESICQVYFIALRNADGNYVAESNWTDEEMSTW